MQTSTETRTTRTSGAGAPESRSNRDNRRGWWMAVATAAIVLTAVLAFNLLGPKNPVRPPGEGHETPASQGAAQTGGPVPDGSVEGAAPQRSDTPTPAGREGMGAPAGAAPAAPAASGSG
ncbi:hypothetical protein L0935_21050, partial [Paracidovorax citrulli]